MRRVIVLGAFVALLLTVLSPRLEAQARRSGKKAKGCVSHCDCKPGTLCSSRGSCVEVFCPEVYEPVCGLDGKTYGNPCQAHAAHVVVANEGECGQSGAAACGGLAGDRCEAGQVCDLPVGLCGGADLQGVCKVLPEVCPAGGEAVCGCDGKTYANDCERLRQGAGKAYDGACQVECAADGDCGEGQFCQRPAEDCSAPVGTCVERPEGCAAEGASVCGCDGTTFASECEMQRAGASLRHDGTCEGGL